MSPRQLAIMVRDNVVHGWRTPDEIAKDEEVPREYLLRSCEDYLQPCDYREVRKAASRGRR